MFCKINAFFITMLFPECKIMAALLVYFRENNSTETRLIENERCLQSKQAMCSYCTERQFQRPIPISDRSEIYSTHVSSFFYFYACSRAEKALLLLIGLSTHAYLEERFNVCYRPQTRHFHPYPFFYHFVKTKEMRNKNKISK